MNSIPLSSRNESERNYGKAFKLFRHLKKKTLQPNQESLKRNFIELKFDPPDEENEDNQMQQHQSSPKRTPKYHSFRHKISKSLSSNVNLSSIGNPNLSFSSMPLLKKTNRDNTNNECKDNTLLITDSEFIQYRNNCLMKNYRDDELLKSISLECAGIFNTSSSILKLLDTYFTQLQQSRQLETYYFFTKFNSNSSSYTFNLANWKEIVSVNYDIAHSLIKLLETILSEYSKERKQYYSLMKFPKLNMNSSTPTIKQHTTTLIHPLNIIQKDKKDIVKDLQQRLLLQEGQHKLNEYHLEEEIKELTYLLGKQNDYAKSNKQMELQLEMKNMEIAQMKRELVKKVEELDSEIISGKGKVIEYEESIRTKEENSMAMAHRIEEMEAKIKEQTTMIHKMTLQFKEYQGSLQELIKEREGVSDYITTMKEKHNDALMTIVDLQKRLSGKS